MGIPLKEGRDLQASDRPGAPLVTVLSEMAARQLFPGRSALGQVVQTGMGSAEHPDGMAFEVVGVCGDVIHGDVREQPTPHCYFPAVQSSRRRYEVALATDQSPQALRPHLQAQLRDLDPRLSVEGLASLRELNLKRLADLRQATWLLGLFAGLGLFLGFSGVASVVSSQVARRTHEIGLRMALGAGLAALLMAILKRPLVQVLAGSLVGAGVAGILGRLVASRLFQTPPTDPLILVLAVLAFCAAAALASLIPALRAAGLDPATALRSE
ncbi:FtsX-like permease family protein [Geothrix sp. PMB-07]|uniref:FtsX-like permease family protein n=1 Tax=Geothrix sp. PMB-07 TaxID=3068640 RepID=UPI0027407EEF|nr:FtsX-like permease family protein [Geothrix sp. PMB-07]WLT31885.1 ABC transporter permease [Geothrix sp. PMB-07]